VLDPCFTGADSRHKEAHPLVVARIEPEHALEDLGRLGEAFQSPETETIAF
jgi:hypothetical protein